jgi:hypothetical protein
LNQIEAAVCGRPLIWCAIACRCATKRRAAAADLPDMMTPSTQIEVVWVLPDCATCDAEARTTAAGSSDPSCVVVDHLRTQQPPRGV